MTEYIINNDYKCYECGFASETYNINFNISNSDYDDAKIKHSEWNLANKLGIVTCSNCKTKNHILIENTL